jgi:hypothetical protein
MRRNEVFDDTRCCHDYHTLSLHITLTLFVPQNHDLLSRPVHIDRLFCAARRLLLRQRTTMLVASRGHLTHQRLMPSIEGFEFPLPPQRLRMPGIALLTIHEYRPNRMQLPMLPQQMIPTEFLWRYIPNPHCSSSVRSCCAMRSLVILCIRQSISYLAIILSPLFQCVQTLSGRVRIVGHRPSRNMHQLAHQKA